MTTEQLEQLMQAHKCWFAVMNSDSGYVCELNSYEHDVIGIGTGPSIIEAVYEALKSKMGGFPDPVNIPLSIPKLAPEDWEEAKRLGLMEP